MLQTVRFVQLDRTIQSQLLKSHQLLTKRNAVLLGKAARAELLEVQSDVRVRRQAGLQCTSAGGVYQSGGLANRWVRGQRHGFEHLECQRTGRCVDDHAAVDAGLLDVALLSDASLQKAVFSPGMRKALSSEAARAVLQKHAFHKALYKSAALRKAAEDGSLAKMVNAEGFQKMLGNEYAKSAFLKSAGFRKSVFSKMAPN